MSRTAHHSSTDTEPTPDSRTTESGHPLRGDLTALLLTARGRLPTTDYGIVLQDPSGAIVAWTPPAEEILNMTGDQMLGRTSVDPLWSTISGDGEPLLGENHPAMTVLRTRTPVTGTLMGVRRGRSAHLDYVWMIIDSYPVDVPGLPPSAITCFHVVEDEQTDRLRLQHSERMFRLITERLHEVVGLHGLDSTWLWASPSTVEVFGYTPDELMGLSTFDLILPSHLGAARSALASILDRLGPVTITLPVRHRSGSTRWVEVIGQLICDPAGRPYQVQSSFRDVTDRVTAQTERDAAVEVFTSILRTSPTGMMLVDATGRITLANDALRRLLGAPEDSRMTDMDILELVHPDSRDHVLSERAAIAADGHQSMRYQAMWSLRAQTATIWIESVTVPIRDGDGTLSAVLEQITDITAEKSAVAELRRRATRDAVTGLLNRDTFLVSVDDAIHASVDDDSHVAMIFVDVDHFKAINDTWGHHIGDAALRSIADRLSEAVGERGWIARYGGDEFAVAHPAAHDEVGAVVDTVSAVFDTPFTLSCDLTLEISASIGLAHERTDDATELVREADRAMYLVKQRRHDSTRTQDDLGR